MRHKKAQLTFFIILGIVVIAAFVYFLAVRKESADLAPAGVPQDFSAIQIYVEDCLKAVTNFAVYKIGKQGGYIETPEGSYRNTFLDVAYAFDSSNIFVAMPKMQLEIEGFVNAHLKECTAGFADFRSKGISIKEGNVKSQVSFGERNVMVVAEYPLQMSSAQSSYSLEKFSATVPVALKTVHLGINSFVSDFDERYDLTYLNSISSNVYIHSMGPADLFVEENPDSSIRGENYLFLYAVR